MLSERKDALRKAMSKMINAYCYDTGSDYAAMHAELNKAVGIRNVRDADEDQLRKRYELAKEWCK